MKPIIYNGYTIEECTEPWALKFGMKYQFHLSGERVFHSSTIEGAKEEIDEICWSSGMFIYNFETVSRGVYAVKETVKAFGKNIDEAMENLEAMIGSKDYRLLSITK